MPGTAGRGRGTARTPRRPARATGTVALQRYAAFLRGVSPTNASNAGLRSSFEAAGFTAVATVLASGNVVFTSRPAPVDVLQGRAERALQVQLGHRFPVIVRTITALRVLLESDPYCPWPLPPSGKRVVTFLRTVPDPPPRLPLLADGARLLCRRNLEVFGDYVPHPRGPLFMRLIEKTLGKDVTTRTWETVRKVALRQ